MKTEYKLLVRTHLTDFENAAIRLLSQGWEPQGGVSITVMSVTLDTKFAQAFVR